MPAAIPSGPLSYALARRWEGEERIGNDTAMARLLIVLGAKVRLSHAVMLEDTALVETLLKAGADVNEDPPEGYSAMKLAVERNLIDIVRLLLDYGYNEQPTDIRPWAGKGYQLYVAADHGYLEIASLLIERGADVNYNCDDTPLHSAADRGHRDIVRLLLENGADVHAKGRYGTSVTDWLDHAKEDKSEIVALIEQALARSPEP